MSEAANRFTAHLNEALASLEADVVAALQKLIQYRYPKEVVALSFELFSDCWSQGFPARVFFMDADNCEHFILSDGEARYPSPIDPDIIDVPHILSREVEEGLLEEDADLDTSSLGAQLFIPWFQRCWEKADGSACKVHATIAEHDDSRELNLQSGLWQKRYSGF